MLNVDQFFSDVLRAASSVNVDGRIFDPARTLEEDELDEVPYIIVSYESGSADGASDDSVIDRVLTSTVNVLVVADDRDSLATMVEAVSDAIADGMNNATFSAYSFRIDNATEAAGAVSFDPEKPCCYQTLTYTCMCSRK